MRLKEYVENCIKNKEEHSILYTFSDNKNVLEIDCEEDVNKRSVNFDGEAYLDFIYNEKQAKEFIEENELTLMCFDEIIRNKKIPNLLDWVLKNSDVNNDIQKAFKYNDVVCVYKIY